MPTACLFPSAPSAPGFGVCSCWLQFGSSFSLMHRGCVLALLCRFTPSYLSVFAYGSPGYQVGCITPHQRPSQWNPKGRASLSHLTPAWCPVQWQGTQVPESPSPAALADLGHCHPLPLPTEHCGPERRLHRKPTDALLAVGGPAPASRPPSSPGWVPSAPGWQRQPGVPGPLVARGCLLC